MVVPIVDDAVFRGRKILIVDDDVRNVFALAGVLEGNGMEVVSGENGREGLAKLEEHPDVGLVLMDIMMPELDGYQTTRAVRDLEQFKVLPIIALTARAALTMQRPDLALDGDLRGRMVQLIADESDRLASIIDELLLASHLDSGRFHASIEECDMRELAAGVVGAADTHLPENISLVLDVDDDVPLVRADPNHCAR